MASGILSFFKMSASNNALTLNANQEPSIYKGHGSHCSHSSHWAHASHYSSYNVANSDSIQSISENNLMEMKKILREQHEIELHRSFIANANISLQHQNKKEDNRRPTLVLIGRDVFRDCNIWIYVSLTSPHHSYSWDTKGVNDIRTNNISELYGECPPSAHHFNISNELLSYINQTISPTYEK